MSKVRNELKDDPLMPLRHTAEHILHTAMQILYPNLKKVMGPPIETGFYMDFDLDESISSDDFQKIETLMQKIVDAKLPIKGREVNEHEAKKIFAGNQYKLDNISEIVARNEPITVYEIGTPNHEYYDADLCSGPHVENTGDVKAFKLLTVAGAYYKGDEKNKMLQRIYGTAFGTKEELQKYLDQVEKAKENDHRKLGKELDLFAFSDLVGKGFVMYTPKGTVIKNELRQALLDISEKYGVQEVNIPHLAKIELYQTSGHAEKFADELYKVVGHYDEEFILKPVNCPHHTQIYASQPRSYRDLPIRYIESTQQHRDEKPGAIGGLYRTRSFEVDDGHTFCTREQIKQEVINTVKIIEEFYTSMGMWGKQWTSLSFRDPATPQKYIGTEEDWNLAEQTLREISAELGLNGREMMGEAALYGPKIDLMFKDALGNNRQLGTVQVDFSTPKRFGLTYTDADGTEKTPVMMHRAILGSYGRFIANLLEDTGGNFPVWLSPVQVVVVPISEKQNEYAKKVENAFRTQKLRVQVDSSDTTMQAKIRSAQLQKVPYMLILGQKEEESETVSLRLRSGESIQQLNLAETVAKIKDKYLTKALDLW